jgi:hypothetical protein
LQAADDPPIGLTLLLAEPFAHCFLVFNWHDKHFVMMDNFRDDAFRHGSGYPDHLHHSAVLMHPAVFGFVS